jgi:transcriptional regulator with XRE-family HTH domain
VDGQARGWSQQDVAERMRPYGHQWSQATVTRLEAATRPIRLNEVADLAALFGIPVAQFLESPDFEWEDLEALELEIATLTVKRDQLRENLDEARYLAMTAREREGAAAAELSHVNLNPPGESGDSICWESVRHGTSSEELPA